MMIVSERMFLNQVPWHKVMQVRITDVAIDKFLNAYVRQGATAYPISWSAPLGVIDIVRTAEGHITKTSPEEIRQMLGKNVFPISSPVGFNISTDWHKLKSKA